MPSKVPYIFLLFIIFSFNQFYAKNTEKNDTILKTFEEINILGEKIPSQKGLEHLPCQIISQEELSLINKAQISSAIALLTNTLIKDYGGTSGLKTISLRGGNSSQTLIMLDNIKINSAQNGSFDLSNLHSTLFDRIEIFKGGASAILGTNSISGTISLSSNAPEREAQNTVKLSFGSYEEYNISAKTNFNFNTIHIKAIASYLSSKNNFDFKLNSFGKEETLQRENADFKGINLALISKIKFDNSILTLNSYYYFSERGTPGAILQGYIEPSKSRLTNSGIACATNYIHPIFDSSTINFSSYFKISNDKFFDPDAPIYQNSTIYYNALDYFISTGYSYYNNFSANFYINYELNKLNSTGLFKNFGNEAIRHNISLNTSISYSSTLAENYETTQSIALRYDYLSDNKNFISYFMGTNLKILPLQLLIRTNYSYNFRVPTFNELYYFNYGNQHLKPEKSHSFSIGLILSDKQNNSLIYDYLELNADLFLTSTIDQISSIPKSPTQWIAENIAEVKSSGIDFSIKTSHFNNLINIIFNYTFQNTIDNSKNSLNYKKNIPYIPQEIITSLISLNIREDFKVGSSLTYNSYMYSLTDNNPNSIIPSHTLINLFTSYKLTLHFIKLTLNFNCNNLFNKTYYHIPNYPLPGRTFLLAITSVF